MAVCSNSTATLTSTPTAGNRHITPQARSSFRLTTATSLAVPWAGPIKKNNAFFFFSYGGLRQVTSAMYTGAITPTANERLGDFTADTFTVYTPGTTHVAANQVDGINTSRQLPGRQTELHSRRPCWTRPFSTWTT